jgi:serine/threonine protein kinase
LRREADLLRRLSHPSVAGFYALEEIGPDDLLVMEFVPGRTLAAVVGRTRGAGRPGRRGARPPVGAADLLGALDHLSGRNPAGVVLVHRNVKPSNVILRADGSSGGARC